MASDDNPKCKMLSISHENQKPISSHGHWRCNLRTVGYAVVATFTSRCHFRNSEHLRIIVCFGGQHEVFARNQEVRRNGCNRSAQCLRDGFNRSKAERCMSAIQVAVAK